MTNQLPVQLPAQSDQLWTSTKEFWVHWQGFHNLSEQLGSVFKLIHPFTGIFSLSLEFPFLQLVSVASTPFAVQFQKDTDFLLYFLHSHLLGNWQLQFDTSLTSCSSDWTDATPFTFSHMSYWQVLKPLSHHDSNPLDSFVPQCLSGMLRSPKV